MEPAVDIFHPVMRVLDRYRSDVHLLEEPSPEEALERARLALGQEVPPSLRRFLERWNGATLFRGALRIRGVGELAPISERVPTVVAFAEGPKPEDRWCFAPDGLGGFIFGSWNEEEACFEPLHEHFERWLAATVQILDENRSEPLHQLEARLDADPTSGFLLLRQAEELLAQGDPDRARALLRKATASDPSLVSAWERLGDTLLGEDGPAARWAYLKALRAVRLPAPHPSHPRVGPRLVKACARLFPAGDDGWERELTWFLDEGVRDVVDHEELRIVEAAGMALARVHLERGDRALALEVASALVDRARGFQVRGPFLDLNLLAAGLEVDLGHHDEAERRLRAYRIAPPALRARADLLIARIAVSRQEPWAEEVLEGLHGRGPGGEPLLRPEDEVEAWTLRGQRHLVQQRWEEAREALSRALDLASSLGDEALAGEARMGLADLDCQQGAMDDAVAGYQEARALAEGHPELLNRILLRRGDLFEINGQPDKAAADYARAAADFHAIGLPLREAWAKVRLARLGHPTAANEARVIFQAADLAAGVAAADSVSGEPAASLEWHLNRAADHSRSRANAQRARPPLSRADADRPERRIGAHRAAISSCDVRVVDELARVLDECARALSHSTQRLTDPNLTRFVAAADLLSGHRSYEASEHMLRLLLEVRPQGLAGRTLVGSMARSSNACLVDGLLQALTGGFDPNGMAAAAEVLGWRREPAAVETLRTLIAEGANPTVKRAAITALGRIGDDSAVPALLDAIEDPLFAEETSVALLLLGEWTGVDHQAQALAAREPGLSRSLGEIVGRYGGPAYLLLLMRTAELEGPAGLGALQGLGYLGDPRGLDRIIEATAARDPMRVRVANGALELLTGHSESAEESLLRSRWLEWWHNHGEELRPGSRYRHGRLMSPGILIERMAHDDALVRRSTYDELVISTGQSLPFDADGPYRVQVAHQTAWRQWWQQAAADYPAGHWWFHGESIS